MLELGLTKLLHRFLEARRQPTPESRRFDDFFVHTIKRIRSKVWLSVAVGCVLAGIGLSLRLVLTGSEMRAIPYVTFFPVITLAALVGGVISASVAIILSATIVHRYFVPLIDVSDWMNLCFFLGSAALILSIVEMFYRAQARAIEAETAKRALEWSAKRDKLLSKIATELLQSQDPPGVVRKLRHEVMEFMNCQVFISFLVDQGSGRLCLIASAGLSEEEALEIARLSRNETVRARPAREAIDESIVAWKDAQRDLLKSFGIQCIHWQPLLEQGRIIGALAFGDRARASLGVATIEVMEAISHLMSLALSRSRMETALRESEERFSRFMSHLMAFAWIKDDDGHYIFVNDAFTSITDARLDQICGMTDEDLFGRETAALFRENDRRAVESPAGLTTVEHLVDNKGVTRHYVVSKFPMPSGCEKKAYVGGVAIDDSQRLQAEERLREVSERLREADRRKDEFLATLAHELRNPLAPIRSGLHVLRKTGGQGPTADKIRSIMERQVEHLVRLVDDLLEVSRISRGAIELRKESMDLASVIESAVETSRQLIDAHNIELRVDFPKEPLRLDADPVRVTQIIANLLHNSAKYTDPGGRISIRAERRGDEAIVTVADTGLGIPAEMLPRVFDLFTQVDRTLGRAQGGLGIGLALVRELVQLHGGSVEALSEGEGKGSCFAVRLPLAPIAFEKRAAQTQAMAPAPTPPRRVLVVDDAQDVADSLALLLETLGAEVRVAYDGAQALDRLAEFKPEIVFLDIGMTGMDGFETARRMREQPQGRGVAVIALTGWGEEETRKRIEANGFDRHLTKPAQIDDLRQILQNADPKLAPLPS